MVSGQTPMALDRPGRVSLVMAGVCGFGGAYTSARRALTVEGQVYTWQCSVGAGGHPCHLKRNTGGGSRDLVSLTADEAVIELDWQRILTDGQPATSPG